MSIGATILHCQANIGTPTVRVGDAHWLSVDGIILVKGENNEDNEVHCRFTYCRENTSQIVTAGKYEIMAMVIGIREHANRTLFKLRGDIFSLVPLCTHDTITLSRARLLYSGSVDSVDRDNTSFQVVTFQWIEGGSVNDKLTVNAILESSHRCPFPYFRVPKVRGMIHFSGLIQNVQDRSLSVIVDTISFLNNKARPSAKTLTRQAKLHPVSPRRHPSATAQRSAKRRALDKSVESWFDKEKAYLDSD